MWLAFPCAIMHLTRFSKMIIASQIPLSKTLCLLVPFSFRSEWKEKYLAKLYYQLVRVFIPNDTRKPVMEAAERAKWYREMRYCLGTSDKIKLQEKLF